MIIIVIGVVIVIVIVIFIVVIGIVIGIVFAIAVVSQLCKVHLRQHHFYAMARGPAIRDSFLSRLMRLMPPRTKANTALLAFGTKQLQ